MDETTLEGVVSALLADTASRLGSTSKKTSSKSKKPSSSSSKRKQSPAPDPEPAPEASEKSSDSCEKSRGRTAHQMAVQSGADDRLESFIIGETPLIMEDGRELWHDMDGGRRYTLNEIATVMGVTRERVRQIEQSALKKAFAAFSAMARREGDNPIDWFRDMFHQIDENHDDTVEYDAETTTRNGRAPGSGGK